MQILLFLTKQNTYITDAYKFKVTVFQICATVTRMSTILTVLQVDPNFEWATWNSATPVNANDVVSAETPVTEEVLLHVRSPFHEVRMAAANYISTLFGHPNGATLTAGHIEWQKRMFEKLCVIIMSSFTVEVQYAQMILFLIYCLFGIS